MTEIDALPSPDDDLIDQIVDGALTPAELRAAVDRIDRLPDGWKRCAAGFLEAQYLRESFRAMGEPAKPRAERQSLHLPPAVAGARRTARRWVRGAMAAGIVAASFAIGWLGHAARPRTEAGPTMPGPSTAILTQPARIPRPPLVTTTVVDDSGLTRSPAQPALDDRFRNEPAELIRTVARLRIGDESAGAEVPILAGPGITEEWLRQQPPPVSEHNQVVFQRHGYQVDQRRRLITTVTADGRRVTVPIDQVLIRYTGNQSL
ncbi:MAG: hypothetical protein ACHRXM_28180 [Isosphaerales bacterium]